MIRKTIRAFALLEVAIALSVLGVIAYMSMPLISKLQNWQQTRVTTTHQEQIMEALSAYVLANKRLPCPAANIGGAAQIGLNVGFVPYQTLGIAEKIAKDGNHHWMTYAVQTSLASQDITNLQSIEGLSMDPRTIFCTTPADGPLAINNYKNESCIVAPDFAAVVIISHGISGGYYLDNGTVQPVSSADSHKIANATRAGNYVTKTTQRNESNIFDDTVLFASRNNLMSHWAKCPCRTPD